MAVTAEPDGPASTETAGRIPLYSMPSATRAPTPNPGTDFHGRPLRQAAGRGPPEAALDESVMTATYRRQE